MRKLPPVAIRNGSTVRFVPEIAGSSIPPDTAIVLREKIRTLLLKGKAGGIQLVDGPADTVIKCIVTGYEPKIIHANQRQVGVQHQQIATWIANMEASVQVLDGRDHPIESADIKYHLENDFIVSKQEDNVNAVGEKKTGWRQKVASTIGVAKGGDVGDLAELAGSGKQIHDALAASEEKGARPPTELEWHDALIEGMAAKVANEIVPVDQEFIAILPADKEFAEIRQLAMNGHWGEVQEETEKMPPLKGANEAYRVYTLGLSYEALGCNDPDHPDKASELLNQASKYYSDARKLKPDDRELLLAQIRVQDSLDHYLEIQHFVETMQSAKNQNPGPDTSAPEPAKQDNIADNRALIDMVNANMAESIMLTFVQTAADPKFDTSANGLLVLARGKVPSSVIQAVQKRMAALANGSQKSAATVKRSSAVEKTH
ncbi:MAG TPA: hypothetical protein VHU83_08630 [Bryobacteraceae bacterium]|nr:hypothetical protein [Bryobacteraceae bacterium]